MSWYKEHKQEWKEIIETISREVNRTPQMIEKDTIQSMFLLELSKTELPFVFKGGTSLSKGYGLIDRFSEDIDLYQRCIYEIQTEEMSICHYALAWLCWHASEFEKRV